MQSSPAAPIGTGCSIASSRWICVLSSGPPSGTFSAMSPWVGTGYAMAYVVVSVGP